MEDLVVRLAMIRFLTESREVGGERVSLMKRRQIRKAIENAIDTRAGGEMILTLLPEGDRQEAFSEVQGMVEADVQKAIGDGRLAEVFLDSIERLISLFNENEDLILRILKLFGLVF